MEGTSTGKKRGEWAARERTCTFCGQGAVQKGPKKKWAHAVTGHHTDSRWILFCFCHWNGLDRGNMLLWLEQKHHLITYILDLKKRIRKMALFPRTVDVFQLETAWNVKVVVVKSGARIRFKLINNESREEHRIMRLNAYSLNQWLWLLGELESTLLKHRWLGRAQSFRFPITGLKLENLLFY